MCRYMTDPGGVKQLALVLKTIKLYNNTVKSCDTTSNSTAPHIQTK
jgi:hypothetical protein